MLHGWSNWTGAVKLHYYDCAILFDEYQRWQKVWAASVLKAQMDGGKEWYEVQNPPGAEEYPPGFLRKNLAVRVVFMAGTHKEGGYIWIAKQNQQVKGKDWEELTTALQGIKEPLDMLVLEGHGPLYLRDNCGCSFNTRPKDGEVDRVRASEFNVDQGMSKEQAAAIAKVLKPNGILVITSCFGAGPPRNKNAALQSLADNIQRAVAASPAYNYGIQIIPIAKYDAVNMALGGWAEAGYIIKKPKRANK
jgi:hypothetical protein